jgi:putative transposase
MKVYRGFPQRLHHKVPDWVEDGALFHLRIALDRNVMQRTLIDPPLGTALLEGAKLYESINRWHIKIFLLMPDHLHTILSFPESESMGGIVGDWKRFYKCNHAVEWQEDFFDHRLRRDERGEQLSAKLDYIRQNPVVSGLCLRAEDWPWVIEDKSR